jgi:hypothetical protein
MASTTGQFLKQLKTAVFHAKVRRGWARLQLAETERQVRSAERNLKRWTRPENKRKRAKK